MRVLMLSLVLSGLVLASSNAEQAPSVKELRSTTDSRSAPKSAEVPPLSGGAESRPVLAFENTAPGVRSVGSKVCAGCHADIYRSFAKTDMGRSMSRMDTPAQLDLAREPVTIHSEKLHRDFQVFRKGGDLYQSEFEIGANGSEVFRNTQKLEYAVGALENAYTYIVKRGNFLYEAPLSYYKSLQAWDLSPGYENHDSGFSRTIATACVACHSGQPQPEKAPTGLFRDPAFLEMPIGCENCHGPGQLHVQARSTAKPVAAVYDRTIVNPGKLPTWLANNVCMSCHEAGQARVVHPGKQTTDFRPGTPLDSVVSLFALAESEEPGSKTQVLSHYQGMTASKCYRASGGKLACITCHDPHVQPENTAAYYKAKCLTCHQQNSCTLPVAERQATAPADNCVSCHMGKKNVATIPHSALTDHRVVKTPDEPMSAAPDDAFTKSTGLVHLDAVPGETATNVMVLRAYTELLAAHPELGSQWIERLHNAMQTDRNDPWVLAQAGDFLVTRGGAQLAEQGREYLFKAIKNGTELPGIYLTLARSLHDAGDVDTAEKVLKQAIEADPSNPGFYRGLITIYAERHDTGKALDEAAKYLQEFPQDDDMRGMMKHLEAARGPQ